MNIELIPVLEITNYNQDFPIPLSGPYWEFPNEWGNYHLATNLLAGFSEHLKPYLFGSSFYKINDLTDSDILKLIHKNIDTVSEDEKLELDDLIMPFSGGFILKIDGIDKYFPQCCSDLSDFKIWEDLLDEEESYFYAGHPSPRIEKTKKTIIFDFLNSEIQEAYVPPIFEKQLDVDKGILKNAIEDTRKELNIFAQKLNRINKTEKLNISEIEKILIYENNN